MKPDPDVSWEEDDADNPELRVAGDGNWECHGVPYFVHHD